MKKVQYTIRNVPSSVDQVIRKRAVQSGKSFNQTVVDLLTQQTFGTISPPTDSNFDWLFDAQTLDADFDTTVANLSAVDEKLWR